MQKLNVDEEIVSHWTMKCMLNSASETFNEMQYLWSIYGPSLVAL